MREQNSDDPRWEERSDALFAKVTSPPPLSDATVGRIFSQIADGQARFGWARRRAALAGGVVAFLGLNAAWAAVALNERHRAEARADRPAPVQPPDPPAAPAPAAVPIPAPAAVTPPPPTIAPAPFAPAVLSGGAPAKRRHPSSVGAPTLAATPAPTLPAPRPSSLEAESAEIGRVVQLLRQQRDPDKALDALQTYRSHFPTGILSSEADLLEVETLVALHRQAEALTHLDRLLGQTPADSARADELHRLRDSILDER